MKCPVCQAKLLPVEDEMFCLQCGNVVAAKAQSGDPGPEMEDTSDPLLQKAIIDAVKHPIHFRLPVSGAPMARTTSSFSSMRSLLASPQAIGAGHAPVALPLVTPVASIKAKAPPPPPMIRRARTTVNWRSLPLAWVMGIVVFGLFLLVNGVLLGYYSTRVYPGVRVGRVNLGGVPLSQVHARLVGDEANPTLVAMVGSTRYVLDTNSLATANLTQAESQVRNEGHNTPLPLAGVLETLLSKPVTLHRQMNEGLVNDIAEQLANSVDHTSSNAVPMIVAGQAFVIGEKVGSQLDEAHIEAAIRAAYGNESTFSLGSNKISPLVTASAYDSDLQSAQAAITLNLQLKFKAAIYSPTPQQIGSWLSFNGPGKGVAVNGSQVAAFIASIPGSFDRIAATNALLTSIQGRKNLNYPISVDKNTATPKLAGIPALMPAATYTYCVQSDSGVETKVLEGQAATALADSLGWSLAGKLKFVRAATGCNFTIDLVQSAGMHNVSPACTGQSTCQVGNILALNLSNWLAVPSSWTGGLNAYRVGMINQGVGNWLGFEHSSCTSKASAVPILQEPAVVLDGCSPNWYEITASVHDAKLQPGF